MEPIQINLDQIEIQLTRGYADALNNFRLMRRVIEIQAKRITELEAGAKKVESAT